MQSKLNKLWEKILASLIVVILMAGDLMIIGNSVITYAEGTIEAQDEKTTHENVEFGAYFIDGENTVHSIVRETKKKEKLYVHLNVKEAGHLKGGSISIEDANYEIIGELEASEIIGKVEGNKITLKQIGFGTDAILEIPIGLKEEEEFNIENVKKESKVVLKGIYVTKAGKEVEIEKEVKLNVRWEESPSYEAETEIITYKKTETGTVIGEKIRIKGNNIIPIAKTEIEIEAPQIGEAKAERVKVSSTRTEMTNGKKYDETEVQWDYDKETGIVKLEVENGQEEQKAKIEGKGIDEYIITYEYEDKTDEEIEINRKGKIRVENYGEKETIKTIENKESLLEEKGNLVNGEIEISAINKAKMYANYNSNRREYETEYNIKEVISNVIPDEVEEIAIQDVEEVFVDEEGKEYSSKIGEVDYTYYKASRISVDNFERVLGEDGEIEIENKTGEEIAKINKETEEKDGYYVVNYEESYGEIRIKVKGRINEGNLCIEHTKGIKADLGYSKEEVENFKEIVKRISVNEAAVEEKQILEEPENKLNLEINKNAVSKKEEEIELKLELGNNNEEAELYTDPTIGITMPSFVEDVEVTKTNLLLEDELEVGRSEVTTNEEGDKVVNVSLKGTQTKFNNVQSGNGSTLLLGLKLNNKQESGEEDITAVVGNSRANVMLKSTMVEGPNEEEIDKLKTIDIKEEKTEQQKIEKDTSENNEEKESIGELSIKNKQYQPTLKAENEDQKNDKLDYFYHYTMKSNEDFTLMLSVNKQDNPYKTGDLLSYFISVLPNENAELPENIIDDMEVTFELPEAVQYKRVVKFSGGIIDIQTRDAIEYNEETRTVVWKLNDLCSSSEIKVDTLIIGDVVEGGANAKAVLTYGNKEIETDILKINTASGNISVTAETRNVKTTNKMGDNVQFIININNNGDAIKATSANFELPNEIAMTKYIANDVEIASTSQKYNDDNIVVSPHSTYKLTFDAIINNFDIDLSQKTKTITVKAKVDDEEITWNLEIENSNYGNEATPKPTEITNPSEDPEYPNVKPGEIAISGLAWIDENENGIKEIGEQVLKEIKVDLVEISTSKVLKEISTDKNGRYVFSGITQGKYQIIFNYNANKYKVTEYLKTGNAEINSSAIESKQKGQATTDTITVENSEVQHINIGLIKLPVFDMKLEQTIEKIIVQNSAEGIREINVNSNMAKTDINSKYINNTVVLVVYKIKITNEGDIEGKISEIVDYIPRDMIFTSDLNPTWNQAQNGDLYNKELKDINIGPGETKELTLILKKNMTGNNVGLSHNVIELSQVENTKNLKDIDSTPGNKIQGEDDMSEADVIIGIRTGEEVAYVTLGLVVAIMLVTGIYMIKRKVLNI